MSVVRCVDAAAAAAARYSSPGICRVLTHSEPSHLQTYLWFAVLALYAR